MALSEKTESISSMCSLQLRESSFSFLLDIKKLVAEEP